MRAVRAAWGWGHPLEGLGLGSLGWDRDLGLGHWGPRWGSQVGVPDGGPRRGQPGTSMSWQNQPQHKLFGELQFISVKQSNESSQISLLSSPN